VDDGLPTGDGGLPTGDGGLPTGDGGLLAVTDWLLARGGELSAVRLPAGSWLPAGMPLAGRRRL
jgi:hypothetical protein